MQDVKGVWVPGGPSVHRGNWRREYVLALLEQHIQVL